MGAPGVVVQPAPAEVMVSLIQTTIATVLGPLVAEQAALRQTVERQADQLVSQAETLGRVTAERDAARAEVEAVKAAHAPQDANPAPVAVEATEDTPVPFLVRLRALAPWLVAVLAIAAMIVLLVVWPG